MMQFVREHVQAIAYLMVAIAAGVAIDLSANHTAHVSAHEAASVLYHSQIQACHRGNSLRRQINARTHESATSRSVLISFLKSAQRARLDSYKLAHEPADLHAAQSYGAQIAREEQVHFNPVALTNCKQAFPKP